MRLMELSAAIGIIDCAAVRGAISRFGKRLSKGKLRAEVSAIESYLSNIEMGPL